jgi:Tfp pilus assembly PilM family ATPase/Tfp pilus assembly protein PilN
MSSLDSFVDSVCFGQGQKAAGPCLGLYLSPETIYIAETRMKDGKLTVDHLVRIPVPQDAKDKTAGGTMTMSTDFLADPAKIGGLIRQSMSQIRWNSKNVVVTLSHHLGLLRFFPMPPIERRFLRSAVPLEAKKYIPIPFDALAYDYQAAPMPPDAGGKPRQGVLINVTQKKNLANVDGLLKSLGLNLIGLEVAPSSVLRLWNAVDAPKGPEPYVQAHFDGGSVRIMICDRGLPVFFREVFLGAEANLSDQRKVDLAGCLGFAQKQLALTGVSKVKLSGTPATLGPWKDAFAQETSLPAEIQDTAKLLSIKGGDWGGYAAIGASARSLSAGAVTLDLAEVDRVSDEERQTARNIIVAGGLAAAIVALLGVYANMTYRYRARELAAYRVDPDVAAALTGLPPSEIDTKLKEMREQLDRLRSVAGAPRPKLSSVLRDVVELMPENVWLTKVSATNPLVTDKQGLEIVISGRSRGATVSDEQDLAFAFKDTLLRSEKIGKAFDVQLSVSGQNAPAASQNDAPMDPRSLARKLEERTEFMMLLKAKRP